MDSISGSTGISTIDSSWSSNLAFSGLGSGTDFTAIIDKLLQVESFTKNRMESWKTEWTDKIDALTELNTLLSDFDTTVSSMNTPSSFQDKTITSDIEGVLTASAASTAASGTHQVLVNQLAQAEKEVHSGVISTSASINTSGSQKVFAFTYDGTTCSITVNDGDSLTDLVNNINNNGANPGVTASILDTGVTGATQYRLVLQGNDMGADYGIAIDGTTTLAGFASGTFTQSQAAQNAQIRVDGIPSGSWVQRTSNTISDAITGVTLNLKSTSASPVTVTIADDTDAEKTKIEDMVTSYNNVIAYLKEQTKYDSDTKAAGILFGNYAAQIVKSKLNDIASGNGLGFANGTSVNKSDTYVNLAQIGIAVDYDEGSDTFGQLLIDDDTLEDALESNTQAVANLFSANFKCINEDDSGNVTYNNYIKGLTQAGRYRIQATRAGGVITSATIDGHPAIIDGDTITGQQGYPEYGLSLTINANGTYDSYIRLQQGKNGQFQSTLDSMTSDSTGPFNILINNYNDIIDGIDVKISREVSRLTSLKKSLTAQYALLDSMLASLNQQQSSLETQLAKLGQ
jgi:flagellar hook-associated protein 2